MEQKGLFNAEAFYNANNVPMAPNGHKHTRPGWINIECPFCTGNSGYHLGYNTESGFYVCWRCGYHKQLEVVTAILRCSTPKAKEVLKEFETGTITTKHKKEEVRLASRCKLPFGTVSLKTEHKQYLRSRKFDPYQLEEVWDLKGTSNLGDYKFRIIAPIYFHKRLVSYQGRDITGKHPLRYKTCKRDKEVRFHKHCLYGLDLVPGDVCVVVEGITDVWRLGPGAVATFGIEYMVEQVELLSAFRKVFILYDSGEVQALKQAEKLAWQLVDVLPEQPEILELEKNVNDPADMSDKDAADLMAHVLKA